MFIDKTTSQRGVFFYTFVWSGELRMREEITIARQKEYMAGLKDDIETDKKEKEEVGCQDCWVH